VAADISHVNTKAVTAVGAPRARHKRTHAPLLHERTAIAQAARPRRSRLTASQTQQRSPAVCAPLGRALAFPTRGPGPFDGGSQGYEGPDALADALKGCDLVIIPAGVPRKPGMTRDDLFKASRAVPRLPSLTHRLQRCCRCRRCCRCCCRAPA
jgi:hypothetical protein